MQGRGPAVVEHARALHRRRRARRHGGGICARRLPAPVLGSAYYRGRGVPQNDSEAAKWFRLAADKGNAAARFTLGVMYGEGRGVPQDYAEAARWYRRAAEQGDAQAQYNLGLAYARGEGVTQNAVEAHMWFNLAAARFPASDTRNRTAAVKNRDTVAGEMTSDQLAEAQKRAREWKPQS